MTLTARLRSTRSVFRLRDDQNVKVKFHKPQWNTLLHTFSPLTAPHGERARR